MMVCGLKTQRMSLYFIAGGSVFSCRSKKGQAGMEKEVSEGKKKKNHLKRKKKKEN